MRSEYDRLSPWDDDWQDRICRGLRRLGYETVGAFCRNEQTATLESLVERLGGQLAPIQILSLWRDEIATQSDFDFYVRSTFVRSLHESCPRGWKSHQDFDLTLALTEWIAGVGEKYKYAAREVANRLKARRDLTPDWLPSGIDDPVVRELFAGVEFPFVRSRNNEEGDG